MANTLIDLTNNILKYNDTSIPIIVDGTNMIWFSGITMATFLEYKQPADAILYNVISINKKPFRDLQQFAKNISKKSRPNAIYINEFGLYALIIKSHKPKALEFQRWVTEQVIPSIRITGSYEVEDKHQKQLENLNQKLRSYRQEIRTLKHNQKGTKYNVRGLVYMIRSIYAKKKHLLKIGKTFNLNKRLDAYNSSVPDDMEVLFSIEVDNPDAVELCIKAFAHKFLYRNKKEYYNCSVSALKKIFMNCDNIIKKDFKCNECASPISLNFVPRVTSNSEIDLSLDTDNSQGGGFDEDSDFLLADLDDNQGRGFDEDNEDYYLSLDNDNFHNENQNGGNDVIAPATNTYYYKYLKYKRKYLNLKDRLSRKI